jgi:hypothetical protein
MGESSDGRDDWITLTDDVQGKDSEFNGVFVFL